MIYFELMINLQVQQISNRHQAHTSQLLITKRPKCHTVLSFLYDDNGCSPFVFNAHSSRVPLISTRTPFIGISHTVCPLSPSQTGIGTQHYLKYNFPILCLFLFLFAMTKPWIPHVGIRIGHTREWHLWIIPGTIGILLLPNLLC
jgi:hypothetical protein